MESTIDSYNPTVSDPLDNEISLISQANAEFYNKEYEKCLETFEKISIAHGNDKIKHNHAVVKFHKSDFKNHQILLNELNGLHEIGAIGCYNKAVIYFYHQKYILAIKTLQPFIENLKNLDENTTVLIGLLMMELLLATNQLNKAQAFLRFLHEHFKLPQDVTIEEATKTNEILNSNDENRHRFNFLTIACLVLNKKPIAVPEDKHIEYSALKAQQYYIMKDFQMAAKQLKKVSLNTLPDEIKNDELRTCIANNMGVIQLRVRHYAIACKFFQTAMSFDKTLSLNMRNTSLYNYKSVHSCEILYNLGISMLHLRQPKEAFQCFLVSLKSYHSNPRLWLRMAEACIMDYEMKNLNGEGKLAQDETQDKAQAKVNTNSSYSSSNQSAAVPELNLEFAALSLRNALNLLQYYKNHFTENNEETIDTQTPWHSVKDNTFCNPSKPIPKDSLNKMQQSIYAAYSFVSLRLGDYLVALQMAEELLKVDQISDAYRILAHLYAGEALIMMKKYVEARPHLDPQFVLTLNVFDFETKDWQIKTLAAAQNIVRFNLAIAFTLQGEIETAKNVLSTCNHKMIAVKAVALNAYLDNILMK